LEFLFATISLLTVTVAASFIYYRRIKQAQGEYEGAQDLVKSITLGFTKQLARFTKTIDRMEEDTIKAQHSAKEAFESSREALVIAKEGLEKTRSLAENLEETGKAMDSLKTEIQRISTSRVAFTPQKDVDAPIPLQQGAILEQLTPTEIEVLSIVEELGEGSVPEIRERINKTREHTARLLKKLYERGFVDRNTSSMPYRYNIRKEIKELIQQQKKRIKISV
jgi:DNA-binding MarR family transcriptional regulator